MFRRKLVLFIRRNKRIIIVIVSFIIIILGISFLASVGLTAVNKISPFFSIAENDGKNIKTEKQKTVVYGNNIKKENYLSDEEIIKKFINYCNNGKIKEAYEMISKDCKNCYYKTQNEFKKLYCDQIFYVSKFYEMQSWISYDKVNTYKIKLITDLFDQGIYDDSQYIEEYYTIVNEGDEKKISINKYIKNVNIDKSVENSGVKVNIQSKDQYMDYEIYTINIENNTVNAIELDSRETTSAIYLLGLNDVKYSSYIHELSIDDLVIESNRNKTVKIKFNKMYNPNIEIDSIIFNDIVMDYKNKNEKLSIAIKLR